MELLVRRFRFVICGGFSDFGGVAMFGVDVRRVLGLLFFDMLVWCEWVFEEIGLGFACVADCSFSNLAICFWVFIWVGVAGFADLVSRLRCLELYKAGFCLQLVIS